LSAYDTNIVRTPTKTKTTRMTMYILVNLKWTCKKYARYKQQGVLICKRHRPSLTEKVFDIGNPGTVKKGHVYAVQHTHNFAGVHMCCPFNCH
jgi:hypothetical protein